MLRPEYSELVAKVGGRLGISSLIDEQYEEELIVNRTATHTSRRSCWGK